MKVLLTGGAGDLGQTLVPKLLARGDTPVVLDIRAPAALPREAVFIQGSILDRSGLRDSFHGCDCIVHIAAWHGIHEARGEKGADDFFDLNVRGTFEVFEAAATLGINQVVHISTTSVHRPDTLYGRSKLLAERIAEDYAKYRAMNVITLRPRAFIPFWNRGVYANYVEWARWFWKGAVHIDDVAAAVLLSIDQASAQKTGSQPALPLAGQQAAPQPAAQQTGPQPALEPAAQQTGPQPALPLDGAYEYTDADLAHWDADGAGSTFRKYYADYYDLALRHALDPTVKPNKLDISETERWLGYKPSFSLAHLLFELATYGDKGPPRPHR